MEWLSRLLYNFGIDRVFYRSCPVVICEPEIKGVMETPKEVRWTL